MARTLLLVRHHVPIAGLVVIHLLDLLSVTRVDLVPSLRVAPPLVQYVVKDFGRLGQAVRALRVLLEPFLLQLKQFHQVFVKLAMQEHIRMLDSFFVCPAIQELFLLLLLQAARRVMQVHSHPADPRHVSTVLLEVSRVSVLVHVQPVVPEPFRLQEQVYAPIVWLEPTR